MTINDWDLPSLYPQMTVHTTLRPYAIRRAPNPKEVRKLNLTIVNVLPEEAFCTNCKGTGVVVFCSKKRFDRSLSESCSWCDGHGKFDWIDITMEKHKILEKVVPRYEFEEWLLS